MFKTSHNTRNMFYLLLRSATYSNLITFGNHSTFGVSISNFDLQKGAKAPVASRFRIRIQQWDAKSYGVTRSLFLICIKYGFYLNSFKILIFNKTNLFLKNKNLSISEQKTLLENLNSYIRPISNLSVISRTFHIYCGVTLQWVGGSYPIKDH
jgi:hypothetical protein